MVLEPSGDSTGKDKTLVMFSDNASSRIERFSSSQLRDTKIFKGSPSLARYSPCYQNKVLLFEQP